MILSKIKEINVCGSLLLEIFIPFSEEESTQC
jgi:hypothetical protein